MKKETKLTTDLIIKDKTIILNDFTQQYIGHVLRGIVASLGFHGGKILFHLHKDELKIFSGDQEVPVRKEFVHQLVTATLKGMLSPMKGITSFEDISITVSD